MFSSEKINSITKLNYCQDDDLQNFIELIWKQIRQQLAICGCVLVYQQDRSPNIIEAICWSNSFWQHKINSSLVKNIKFDFYESESEIYFDSSLSGYISLITKNNIYSRYLIFFCDRNCTLSVEQKQIIKIYNQLLQQYLFLDNQYKQKENDFKLLEDLFYQMGHQLRTPLAEISIIAETILLSSTTSFCKSQAEAIKNKITNLNLDIGNFIQLHKQAKDRKNTQDIKKILQGSIEGLENLINNKKIQVKYPQQTILLRVNKLKIKQIFDNLLSNAIYFSPEGETIDCHWQSFQEEILISICDRGCGLSSEDIQNMFLPFYSRRENGQGLGLTIVKKIILDLKGNIWAENISQGGTKISLVLPKNN
ncbi:MAG: HAMP domain-containing sensor histidine kinase [Xenococcaceae cyanobacterium MO_188.B29]|nr:HAMP domain-containing sensor histidine kinase [Xenococcaceae cyanobacterium MO_188.B29]